jgi:hypothetical protein
MMIHTVVDINGIGKVGTKNEGGRCHHPSSNPHKFSANAGGSTRN